MPTRRRSFSSDWPIYRRVRLAFISLFLLPALLPVAPLAAAPTGQDDPAAQCREGMRLVEAGESDKALPLLQAGVAAGADAPFDDPQALGECAVALGALLKAGGNLNDALAAYQAALQVFETNRDDAAALTTLEQIGAIYGTQGQSIAALDAYTRVRDLARTLEDRPSEMVAIANMFTIFHKRQHWQEAMETAQQMQHIGREITQTTGDALFESIGLLFTMIVLVGQWRCTEAHAVGRQALDLAGDDQRFDVAGSVSISDGECSYIQGRYDHALQSYQQALAISRARSDQDQELIALAAMAKIYRTQGRYDEALDALQQALQRAREVGDRDGESTMLSSIGMVYRDQKRYDEALDMVQQALQIARDQRDRFDEALELLHLGEIYSRQQRHDAAQATYHQLLDIARAINFREMEGFALTYQSEDYAAQQRLDEALHTQLQALDVFDTLRTTAGSEAARVGLVEQHFYAYDRPVWLAHQLGQDDLAFEISERGRARAFLDSLATGQIELSDDAADVLFQRERETALAVRQAQDALNQFRAQAPADVAALSDLEAQLTQADAAHAAAQQAITQRNDQLATLVPQRAQAPLTRAEAQALLPADTTLVSYWIGVEQTLIFVLTRDRIDIIERPIGIDTVDQQVQQLRDTLQSAQPQAVDSLYQELIAPLHAYVRTPHLMIVPHRALHYLPFAALHDGNGRLLMEEFTLSTLPNASVLRFLQRPAPTPGVAPTALALGNPDHTLRGAATEAQAVANLFAGQALLRETATKPALRERAPQADILHFATHGVYNPEAPLASYLTLAPTTPMTATTAPAGADDFSARLEVAEVYGLDLRQADLVVLSACETNLGALSNGDDLVGLTRAFFFAGTPSVVASLWRVPDDATQQLMMQFYTHLRAGVGKAEALRQAQRDMRQYRDDVGRQPYAAPYYWASFVLVGEGTGALVAVPWWQRVSWWGWAAALGAIVAVAVVSLFWNRLQKTSRSM